MARVIDQVLGATTSSVVGEITRELVNASDGAGLHFDGAAGYIDIASPPDLGTAFSFEFVVKADAFGSDTRLLVDFGNGGRLIFGSDLGISYNLGIYDNTSWKSFGVKVVDDLKVHHLVATVDGTAATLYDNGNQVGTATISSSHNLDNCADAKIATNYVNTGGQFNGTIYRARFYNKALSSAEVQTAYERADVPVADQYGEQNLVDADASAFTSGTYSWTAYGTNTIANVSNDLVITYGDDERGAFNYLRNSSDLNQDLVAGKKYRLRITAKYAGGASGVQFEIYNGATTEMFGVLTTTFAEYDYEFTVGSGATSVYLRLDGLASSNVVTIDTWQLDEIGCVSDYDLAFASPTQSLTVQDRSNAADGTASTSGVTQVQPVVQGNLTSLAVQTSVVAPADGQIISKTQKWGASGDAGTITYDSNNAIVKGQSGKGLQLGGGNNVNVTIDTSGNVGVGDTTPTSPGGVARFVEISGTSASLVLTDSDSATWEWISAGGNLKAAKDGSDKLTIDTSGNVNVNGGGYVKIAPANTTAELRLYRDDSTINASGIAIGDINFGGADADNDNAARLRVKSDGAWTSTSSPTAFEFQTCPSGSESPQTRLVIGSDGLCTFSNGITVSDGFTNIGSSFTEVTIASGAITVTKSVHFVDTEGDAATDDLDTINGGITGALLILRNFDNSRDVTVKDATGNIYLAGDFALNNGQRKLTLMKFGGGWYELSRSANA